MISKADLKDVDAIANLVNSAYRGSYAKKGWTTEADLIDGTRTDASSLAEIIARPDTTLLKYERDGGIIACVELKITENKVYLGMLTVEPSIQGGGIGKELLRAAEVEQEHSPFRRNVNVIRLDVAMHHARAMHQSQRVEDKLHQP